MKPLSSLLILFFGAMTFAFAQEKKETKTDSPTVSLHHGKLLIIPRSLTQSLPSNVQLDSNSQHLPRLLYSERDLKVAPKSNIRIGHPNPNQPTPEKMPTYELPDPQSQMPVKDFPDTANYTMLIKEYK